MKEEKKERFERFKTQQKEFVEEARKSGFDKEQADFLFAKFYPHNEHLGLFS